MKGEEILTCLILVAIGYFIAKMFSRTCNRFRVGGRACKGYPQPPGWDPREYM